MHVLKINGDHAWPYLARFESVRQPGVCDPHARQPRSVGRPAITRSIFAGREFWRGPCRLVCRPRSHATIMTRSVQPSRDAASQFERPPTGGGAGCALRLVCWHRFASIGRRRVGVCPGVAAWVAILERPVRGVGAIALAMRLPSLPPKIALPFQRQPADRRP